MGRPVLRRRSLGLSSPFLPQGEKGLGIERFPSSPGLFSLMGRRGAWIRSGQTVNERFGNLHEHEFGVADNCVVGKPKDSVTGGGERLVTRAVIFDLVSVNVSVELDHESRLVATKIGDVASKRTLTAKLGSAQLAGSEATPQPPFWAGRFATHFSCQLNKIGRYSVHRSIVRWHFLRLCRLLFPV
jgi:hypothetical protein